MALFLTLDRPLLMDWTLSQLSCYLGEHGKSRYLAEQVFSWVYKKNQSSPSRWTNISRENRAFIQEQFDFRLPEIAWWGESKDGTLKFLMKMVDGKTVESVVIFSGKRRTLCLSTQVGCAIGCTFCHTGTQGLSRHLRAGEIVGQYAVVQRWLQNRGEGLTHMVYMGMGEPLHNFDEVKTATTIFLEPKGCGFGQRRITLSTSGLVPQIEKLSDFPPINIAISLHGAHNDIRSKLMPINKRYDLERLFRSIESIPLKAHRRITYEYLLIDGLNNHIKDAKALSKLLCPKRSKVNLIPFNSYPGSPFKRPSKESVERFQEELCARGLVCTVRQTKGEDIMAACGQLKTQVG